MVNLKKNIAQIVTIFFVGHFICLGQDLSRVITTGVPFLLIAPDARAAGMGDLGVATPADATRNNGIQLNTPLFLLKKYLALVIPLI